MKKISIMYESIDHKLVWNMAFLPAIILVIINDTNVRKMTANNRLIVEEDDWNFYYEEVKKSTVFRRSSR